MTTKATAPAYIRSRQATMFGHDDVIGFGTDDFSIREVDRELANETIIRNHYSGKVFPLSAHHHGVFIGGKMVGVLQWGPGMNPASGGGVVRDTKPGEWLELNRMWLADEAPRNSESRAISYSIRLLRATQPGLAWVQSFADERCGGLGVVYQACSFLYLGEHVSIFWELDGEWFHNIAATVRGATAATRKGALRLQANMERATKHELRQFRYFFPLKNKARKALLLPVRPYPKRDAAQATKEEAA